MLSPPRDYITLSYPFALFVVVVVVLGNPFQPMGIFGDDGGFGREFLIGHRPLFHGLSSNYPLLRWVWVGLFQCFQFNFVAWNLYNFLCVYLGALLFYGALSLSWRGRRAEALIATSFYLLYPYCLRPNTVTYSAHMTEQTMWLLSIFLTVWSERGGRLRNVKYGVSLLLGLLVLFADGEYFFSFEFVRVVLILCARLERGNWKEALRGALIRCAPFLFALQIAGVYRATMQQSRGPYQLSKTLEVIREDFVGYLLRFFLALWSETVKTLVSSWTKPLNKVLVLWNPRGLLDRVAFLSLLFSAGVYFVTRLYSRSEKRKDSSLPLIAMVSGLGIVVLSHVPHLVTPGMIQIHYLRGSERYVLGALPGVGLFLAGFFSLPILRSIRAPAVALLAGLAACFHLINHQVWKESWDNQKELWREFSWRVPVLKNGTEVAVLTDELFRLRNLAAFDDGGQMGLGLMLLSNLPDSTITAFNETENFQAFLKLNKPVVVVTMPAPGRCLRLLEKSRPEEFPGGKGFVLIQDRIDENSVLNGAQILSYEQLIPGGPPPSQNFCWYFERASLARQKGDWATVAKVADEVRDKFLMKVASPDWEIFAEGYRRIGRHKDAISLLKMSLTRPAEPSTIAKTEAF